jgi:hypothetical protein
MKLFLRDDELLEHVLGTVEIALFFESHLHLHLHLLEILEVMIQL